MNKRQICIIISAAIIAGFLGGTVSDQLFRRLPLLAQNNPKYAELISTKRLYLVDEHGIPLVILAPGPKQKPSLVFFEGGKPHLTFGISELGEPFLVFYDANGKFRTGFGLMDGKPFLRLLDKEEKSCITILQDEDGQPMLKLHDKNGRVRIGLGVVKEKPSLVMFDEPMLRLFEGGKVIWSAP